MSPFPSSSLALLLFFCFWKSFFLPQSSTFKCSVCICSCWPPSPGGVPVLSLGDDAPCCICSHSLSNKVRIEYRITMGCTLPGRFPHSRSWVIDGAKLLGCTRLFPAWIIVVLAKSLLNILITWFFLYLKKITLKKQHRSPFEQLSCPTVGLSTLADIAGVNLGCRCLHVRLFDHRKSRLTSSDL